MHRAGVLIARVARAASGAVGSGKAPVFACTQAGFATDAATLDMVKDYYGKVLASSKDLKTSACTASGPPPLPLQDALAKVPLGVTERFYGCGTPLPTGIDGLRWGACQHHVARAMCAHTQLFFALHVAFSFSVLDLGSGSGRDSYVAASLVGPSGSVTGLDMTDEQLEVARKHVDVSMLHAKLVHSSLACHLTAQCAASLCVCVCMCAHPHQEYAETVGFKPNLQFVKGEIEFIKEVRCLGLFAHNVCESNQYNCLCDPHAVRAHVSNCRLV